LYQLHVEFLVTWGNTIVKVIQRCIWFTWYFIH